MKVGIMQPYFMPYIGYFQLMAAVDQYVVYDDVNYIKGGWVARNYLIIGGEKKMFHIELSGASPNKLFNEIDIKDNFHKLRNTLQTNYSKAPYFTQTMNLMEQIFSCGDRRLSNFISNSFSVIWSYLSIDTQILMSSEIDKDNTLRGEAKVIEICKQLKAEKYYNAIGGQELYDKTRFQQNNIELKFLQPILKEYPQTSSSFVPGLSMIDVLMNNSVSDVRKLLDCYELI